MTRIVTIIGTDGSGKTTLSDRFVQRLRDDGHQAERVWLGAESRLMLPARAVLKPFWRARKRVRRGAVTGAGGGPTSDRGYSSEIARKNALASRHPLATRAYVALALADYRLQILAKLVSSRRQDVIVADRYVFDVAVNIGLALGWSPDEVVGLAQRQLAVFPTPQVRVFLRVPPEVSLSRKDDIPDIDYLRLRLAYYDAIAAAFGFTVYDGTLPIEDNVGRLTQLVANEFDKPHVHYVHANNEDVGGADRVLALMAAHARTPVDPGLPSFRVSVSLRQRTAAARTYERTGIPVLLHPFVRPQVSGRARSVVATIARTPSGFWHFWRLLGRERPDIVHVNDLYDFLPAAAARVRGIPVVYHLRMIKTSSILRTLFARLIPTVADTSVSVSDAVRRHYFADGRGSAHEALVIHDLGNAWLSDRELDIHEWRPRPAPLPSRGRLVVMIGRVEPWKGQDVFLEAVQLLPDALRTAHVFALVGGGVPGSETFFSETSSRARSLGVELLGERHDVPEILLAADVSVHCSRDPDPFPGVVIESLLAGAATVAADAGGVPEMIDRPEVGVLTRPGDAQALSAAIARLLSLPESPRVTYGARGRERALLLVDPNVVDAQIAHRYSRLAPTSGDRLVQPSLSLRDGKNT